MPELTEIEKPTASATEAEKKNDAAADSDSDSDDTIPELEDAGSFLIQFLNMLHFQRPNLQFIIFLQERQALTESQTQLPELIWCRKPNNPAGKRKPESS